MANEIINEKQRDMEFITRLESRQEEMLFPGAIYLPYLDGLSANVLPLTLHYLCSKLRKDQLQTEDMFKNLFLPSFSAAPPAA